MPTALIGDIRPDDIPVADIEALLGVKVSAAGSNVVAFPGARPVPVPGQPFLHGKGKEDHEDDGRRNNGGLGGIVPDPVAAAASREIHAEALALLNG